MDGHDAQERQRRQIERLLAFPRVGPLAAAAIAVNLGVPAGSLAAVIEALCEEGRILRLEDGRFTLPATGSEH
jgi:hypothetical protein